MQKVPEKFRSYLLSQRETGMGYWVVDVTLNDGKVYKQVVIDSGYFTKVRGFSKIPFFPEQVEALEVTHQKWIFSEEKI
jgi:hypothetical protein